MLRREGLYSSHVIEWRRARDSGALAGQPVPRGRPAADPRIRRSRGCARRRPSWSRACEGPLRGGCVQAELQALLETISEGRGYRARAELVTDEAIALLAPRIGTRAACTAAGVPQATWYRRHRISAPPPQAAPVPHAEPPQPRALAAAERQTILYMLHSERLRHRPGRSLGDAAGRGHLPRLGIHLLPGAAPGGESRERRGGPRIRLRSSPNSWRQGRTRSTPGTSPGCTAPAKWTYYHLYVICLIQVDGFRHRPD